MATPGNNITLDDTFMYLTLDKSQGNVSVNIPAANTATRFPRFIKVQGNNASTARITPASGTIDGQPYFETTVDNKGIIIAPEDNNNWNIYGTYP